MTATIQEVIMKACDLPAVPDVTQKVMSVLADPNADSAMVCKVISDDPSLTARILKIANSAFYGCLRTVNNLQSAVVIIGFSAIKSLVIAVSTKEVYKKFGLTERMLWEHSVGVGVAAHLLAREAKISKVDDVFVCGLMHDLGKVIMNNSDAERYGKVMEKTYNDGVPALEAEQEIFGFTHPEVGALVVRKWNLTEELELAIRHHHDPAALDGRDQYLVLLGSLVHLADRFCHRLGLGTKGPDPDVAVHGTEAAGRLGIPDDRMDELLATVQETYSKEREIFS